MQYLRSPPRVTIDGREEPLVVDLAFGWISPTTQLGLNLFSADIRPHTCQYGDSESA